jgi:mannonate dehydratase
MTNTNPHHHNQPPPPPLPFSVPPPPPLPLSPQVRERIEAHGLRLACVEGGPPMDKIVQGAPGRDEQIEHYKKCIMAMGEAGIPILCYNFMPWGFRVGRTSYETPCRGGSLTSEWRWEHFDDTIRTPESGGTHEKMWENFEYFLKAVVPVAEKAGVYLACHPDDPPVPHIRGMARIMHSPDAFERMIKIVDSPHNGITFCQGCFSEMEIDMPATIRRLGHRTHFVHFRDVIGTAKGGFVETWQDEGQTDMHAAMATWKEMGFNGG